MATLCEGVLSRADAVLDFHGGGWSHALGVVTYGTDYPDSSVNVASRELARAVGWPYLRATPAISDYPGPRSVLGWVGGSLGRPVAMVGLGGAGFGADWDERWTAAQLRGIQNVLFHLGLLVGQPQRPERELHFTSVHNLTAPAAGLLSSRFGPERIGAEVQQDEPLAEIYDPATLTRSATITTPCRGVLVALRGNGPVRPLASCFTLADVGAEETG